jgi:hypothetical protein
MDGWYLEPPENNVSFNSSRFAQSLVNRALDDQKAEQQEKRLEIIELVCYSGRLKICEVNLKALDRTAMEETFAELQMYESDEHGEADTDLNNEGQTIVEINRIAGMEIHFNKFKPKGLPKKQRRFI